MLGKLIVASVIIPCVVLGLLINNDYQDNKKTEQVKQQQLDNSIQSMVDKQKKLDQQTSELIAKLRKECLVGLDIYNKLPATEQVKYTKPVCE